MLLGKALSPVPIWVPPETWGLMQPRQLHWPHVGVSSKGTNWDECEKMHHPNMERYSTLPYQLPAEPYSIGSRYVSNYILLLEPDQPLRSSGEGLLHIVTFLRVRLGVTVERAFSWQLFSYLSKEAHVISSSLLQDL